MDTRLTEEAAPWGGRAGAVWRRVADFFESLAGRLLILTAAAVVAGELLIFIPALAGFHETWLRDRINLAQIAALALEVAPQDEVEIAEPLEFELLENAEVLRVAMQRARFCEQAATLCGQIASEQYLIGLVSMFPAMLRTDMESVIKMLPLRERASAVLRGKHTAESVLLEWIASHEQGAWDRCEEIVREAGLSRDQLVQRHSDAVAWADLVLFNAG